MAAADQIVFSFQRDRINERSRLVVTARFRDRTTDADVTPTNVKYRLDNITSGAQIADWTTATASTSVAITLTSAQNECTVRSEQQRNLLTVAADYGLSTEFSESLQYEIRNLDLVRQ